MAALARPASAQQRSGGPFSGLFTGSPKDQPHTLQLRGSAFAAWDDNVFAQAGLPGAVGNEGLFADPRHLKRGLANGFDGAVSYGYRRSGARSQFGVSGDAAFQEFGGTFDSAALWLQVYNATASLSTSVTNKTSVSVSAGTSYMPFYQYAPFLKDTAAEDGPVGDDYGFVVDSTWVRSLTASASIENRFSKRSNVSAGIGWDDRVMPAVPDSRMQTRRARAGFSHNVTRKLSFHLGYALEETRFVAADSEATLNHMMDIGLGYGDNLTVALGRRTTLSLSIGLGVARNGDPASVVRTGKATALYVNGSAILSRAIGRTWNASGGYTRGTSYVVGFLQPMFSDAANVGIGGPIAQRLHFSAGAGAARMQQLFTEDGQNIVSYTASTRLTYGLFTYLGLYGQASYYRYSIPPSFVNQLGFVPDLDRRSVSVGLSSWYPLIKPRRGKQ